MEFKAEYFNKERSGLIGYLDYQKQGHERRLMECHNRLADDVIGLRQDSLAHTHFPTLHHHVF